MWRLSPASGGRGAVRASNSSTSRRRQCSDLGGQTARRQRLNRWGHDRFCEREEMDNFAPILAATEVGNTPLTGRLCVPNLDSAPMGKPLNASLQFPLDDITVGNETAQPERRETRKSMSRRSGQSGNLVKEGRWWRVRFRLDQPGVEKRRQLSLKVAPVRLRLSRPELERRAAEIVQKAGANSEERFKQIVLGEVSFREQAKAYLQKAVSRNRKPLRNTVSIEGAMRKWIYPAVGDLPLRLVDNLAVRPLVEK